MDDYKEFSKEFMQDLLDVLKRCAGNGTDNCTVQFDLDGTLLDVKITFSVPQVNL